MKEDSRAMRLYIVIMVLTLALTFVCYLLIFSIGTVYVASIAKYFTY